jgi:hypothetical protein
MAERESSSNRLGPIARSYDELQSLPALLAVVHDPAEPEPGTAWQALRATYQGAEVALATLAQLSRALAGEVEAGRWAEVARTVDWLTAFGRTWADLAWRSREVLGAGGVPAGAFALTVVESPNWADLQAGERELARVLTPLLHTVGEDLKRALLNYVMLQRTGREYLAVDGAPAPYPEFVRPEELRAVVRARPLAGDTVFLQFRSAHQVPEILAVALNDHLEVAVREIDSAELGRAVAVLRRAECLLEAMVLAVDLLAGHLGTDEYHAIRENLGLTSGSHSVALHYHLMRDLYPALRERADRLAATEPDPAGTAALAGIVRDQVHTLGIHLDRWRLAHLSLPRNNLGAADAGVRSLTGTRDALGLVSRMRERARPAADAARAGFRATDRADGELALAPVESLLLDDVAGRTRERFPDVQARSGYFAQAPAFEPPTERVSGPERTTR